MAKVWTARLDGPIRREQSENKEKEHSPMAAVGTVRDAWMAGWKGQARCLSKRRAKPKDTRDCGFSIEIDMGTLAMTKGPNFPLSMLGTRLMCPRCNGREIAILFEPPKERNFEAA
jgi:hypothetical protein